MGGVSRYFSKVLGSGSILESTLLTNALVNPSLQKLVESRFDTLAEPSVCHCCRSVRLEALMVWPMMVLSSLLYRNKLIDCTICCRETQTGSFVTGSFRQALATRSSSAPQTFVSIVFAFAIARRRSPKFSSNARQEFVLLTKATRLECTCLGFPDIAHQPRPQAINQRGAVSGVLWALVCLLLFSWLPPLEWLRGGSHSWYFWRKSDSWKPWFCEPWSPNLGSKFGQGGVKMRSKRDYLRSFVPRFNFSVFLA